MKSDLTTFFEPKFSLDTPRLSIWSSVVSLTQLVSPSVALLAELFYHLNYPSFCIKNLCMDLSVQEKKETALLNPLLGSHVPTIPRV